MKLNKLAISKFISDHDLESSDPSGDASWRISLSSGSWSETGHWCTGSWLRWSSRFFSFFSTIQFVEKRCHFRLFVTTWWFMLACSTPWVWLLVCWCWCSSSCRSTRWMKLKVFKVSFKIDWWIISEDTDHVESPFFIRSHEFFIVFKHVYRGGLLFLTKITHSLATFTHHSAKTTHSLHALHSTEIYELYLHHFFCI